MLKVRAFTNHESVAIWRPPETIQLDEAVRYFYLLDNSIPFIEIRRICNSESSVRVSPTVTCESMTAKFAHQGR
ncbi:MAG: hypothetical protein CMJ48_03605 [Planctomycetaceae bacterium]|nr:hypothetical protein [Planctomycetaceae bacterium]